MKLTKLLTMLTMFLLMTGLVNAQGTPMPINGKLTGDNVAFQEIKCTNVRTGVSMTTTTSAGADYLFDWSNSGDIYINGDDFKVEVMGCSMTSSDCVQTLTYTGQPELFTTFDLSNVVLSCPSCPSASCGGGGGGGVYVSESLCQQKYPCESSKVCAACAQETECPIIECPVIDCPTQDCPPEKDCPPVEECPPPETDDNGVIVNAIVALLSGLAAVYFTRNKILGVRSGIKKYTNLKGEQVIYHRHPGIRGYHDPITVHKEAHERHPKGQIDPHYEKGIDGIYRYVR